MRVGDALYHDGVAAAAVGVDNARAQAAIVEVLDETILVAMDVVEKRLAVGHQELQVTYLGMIDRRKVDFADHAARDGEPDGAGGGVGGADDILGAMGPARLDTGGSLRDGKFFDNGHQVAFLSLGCGAERSERGGRLRRRLIQRRLRTKHVGDAHAQHVKQQQRNREQENRHHVGRSQRRRNHEDAEYRVTEIAQHHAVIDEPEPGEKNCENRHLEGQREGQHQLGRERQVFADANRWSDADRGVLLDEERVTDLENHRPAEIPAQREEQARADHARQRHPPLRLEQAGRDELPNLVEYRRAGDKHAGDQRDFDFGEESLANASADQQQLAPSALARRQWEQGEKVVGENVRQRASRRYRDHRPHQPTAQLAQMVEQRHTDLLRRGGGRNGGGLLNGHGEQCGYGLSVGGTGRSEGGGASGCDGGSGGTP